MPSRDQWKYSIIHINLNVDKVILNTFTILRLVRHPISYVEVTVDVIAIKPSISNPTPHASKHTLKQFDPYFV